MRVAAEITLSKEEHRKLEKWASARSTPVRLRERARIVLMASKGMTNKTIAAELGTDANKVGRWRSRVAHEGVSCIEKERPRGANHGGKNSDQQAALRSQVLEATTQSMPSDATHWSCRSMARHLGTTHSFVNRVWRAHGLKPHLVRTFKLSKDPRFEEKLRDVVGLYLDPVHNAAVFSFDEKSQIQALDRTPPGLPMKKGRCETMTHDYKRHGTTTLFAALNVSTGARSSVVIPPSLPFGPAPFASSCRACGWGSADMLRVSDGLSKLAPKVLRAAFTDTIADIAIPPLDRALPGVRGVVLAKRLRANDGSP